MDGRVTASIIIGLIFFIIMITGLSRVQSNTIAGPVMMITGLLGTAVSIYIGLHVRGFK